jgi:hypothetical protein
MSQADGSMFHAETPLIGDREDDDDDLPSQQRSESLQTSPQSTFLQARQRRKIAELEGKIEVLESGRAVKERHVHHFVRWADLAHYLSGKRITSWLKAEALNASLLCLILLKILSPKTTEDTMIMTRMPLLSKFSRH